MCVLLCSCKGESKDFTQGKRRVNNLIRIEMCVLLCLCISERASISHREKEGSTV